MCVCLYVCIYVCMYVFMYVYMCVCLCTYVCLYVCLYVCIYVCMYICMYVYCVFFIDISSMSHYIEILHASHNLSLSFTITFTFNDNKTIVEVHYKVDNNFLTSSLKINNIYIHSLRSIYLSTYLSFIVKLHCKSVKSINLTNFTKIIK